MASSVQFNTGFSLIITSDSAILRSDVFLALGFTIKYRAKNTSDLRIAESLMIIKEKPVLNCTELATRLMIFSSIVLESVRLAN